MAKTEAQAKKEAQAEFDALESPLKKSVDGVILDYDSSDNAQWITDRTSQIMYEANEKWAQDRQDNYPPFVDFVEAYTEKEIGGDDTKWKAYKTAYEKVRSDYPKPS
tara:strand:- start:75 stop:395 length:321 start_codon:yes stop_codon:yes gene_type:complete